MNTSLRSTMPPNLQALVAFYETLTPEAVHGFGTFYATDARFKDPFNDVTGLPAIERIFRHMFVQVDAARFHVTGCFLPADRSATATHAGSPAEAMLCWELHFSSRLLGPGPQRIVGSTRLTFNDAGLVTQHRDYWDSGEELFARLPVFGVLVRALRRRLAA